VNIAIKGEKNEYSTGQEGLKDNNQETFKQNPIRPLMNL